MLMLLSLPFTPYPSRQFSPYVHFLTGSSAGGYDSLIIHHLETLQPSIL